MFTEENEMYVATILFKNQNGSGPTPAAWYSTNVGVDKDKSKLLGPLETSRKTHVATGYKEVRAVLSSISEEIIPPEESVKLKPFIL